MTKWQGQLFGQIGLLLTVIIVVRVLPRASPAGPARTDLRPPWDDALAFSGLRPLDGPQTLGRGPMFWIGVRDRPRDRHRLPLVSDGYTVGNTVYFFVWVFMALGLCLIWGYGGILSFGQTAFFGIAGYAYGVITLNFGADHGLTIWATLAAVALSALVAAVLGYFMFFGRISGVFLGIVTLAVTLVLERFMAQTAGPEWHIGAARLNGFNGMNGMPPLTIPWPGEDGPIVLAPDRPLYYVVLALLVLVYLGAAHPGELVASATCWSRSGKTRSARNAGL